MSSRVRTLVVACTVLLASATTLAAQPAPRRATDRIDASLARLTESVTASVRPIHRSDPSIARRPDRQIAVELLANGQVVWMGLADELPDVFAVELEMPPPSPRGNVGLNETELCIRSAYTLVDDDHVDLDHVDVDCELIVR